MSRAARARARKRERTCLPNYRTTPAAHRKISVPQAAALNNLSEDSFRRHYSHLILKVSERRDAVKLADALAIGTKPTE